MCLEELQVPQIVRNDKALNSVDTNNIADANKL